MSDTKHTPGPWKDQPFDMASCRVIPEGNQFFSVAAVSGFDSHEATANAKLIAAAPELLESLQTVDQIYSAWLSDERLGWEELCNQLGKQLPAMRAAIAKATGKEQP